MKRLAFICSLLFSVAFAQTFEYGYIFETANPMNPAKNIVSFRFADSEKRFERQDSTGNKFAGILPALNYFGNQGWRVVDVEHQTIQRVRQSAYLIERKNPKL